MIIIHAKPLFDNLKNIGIIKNLTKIWSSIFRYDYKRLLEGMNLNASYDPENLRIIKPLNEFVSQEPVKPRILLNLLVAGFLGLTLGVFAALVI